MSGEHFDVLVVGAGPAGSSLALRLGRAGFRVALADARSFPRAKPCGEFLSPQCLPLLEGLDVRSALEERGARVVRGMRIHGFERNAQGTFRDVGGSRTPHVGGWAIRREILDHELVRAATGHETVRWFEGWALRALRRGRNGAIIGARLQHRDGTMREIDASWTVGADGVRSRVARDLQVQERDETLDKLALTLHMTAVDPLPEAEIHLFRGGYFAATTVEEGIFSLNLVLDRRAITAKASSGEEYLATYLREAPELGERLHGARPLGRVRGIGPLAFRTRAQAFDGAALVGDACGYVDPMTGEGIYFALRGAELLAADLEQALLAGRRDRGALGRYVRARRREITPRMWFSRVLQSGLRREEISRRVLGVLQRRPGCADLLVSFAGDYVRFRELLRPSVWRSAWGALPS